MQGGPALFPRLLLQSLGIGPPPGLWIRLNPSYVAVLLRSSCSSTGVQAPSCFRSTLTCLMCQRTLRGPYPGAHRVYLPSSVGKLSHFGGCRVCVCDPAYNQIDHQPCKITTNCRGAPGYPVYRLAPRPFFFFFYRAASSFARQTGDLRSLSRVDLRVIALTYMLERQETGASHLRTTPVRPVRGHTTQ